MSILDKLLETDIAKIAKRETKKVEVKRLSALLGEPFIVECRPLTSEQFEHISEISKTNAAVRENAILETCRIDSKKLNCKELLDKFQVVTGQDVLQKLFLLGEISSLYDTVSNLSGYNTNGETVIEEIKN